MGIVGTILVCLVIADVITGVVHWWEDTYGLPDWPLVGPAVIQPNILHHQQPGLIGRASTLVSRNYQSVVPALAVSGIIVVVWGWGVWPVVLTLMLSSFGNEIHTWNHRTKNNRVITFLQNSGLVQSPRNHSWHHKAPYDTHFCTLTNFTNEVFEIVQFWRWLEWFGEKVFRVKPKRMSPEREGV